MKEINKEIVRFYEDGINDFKPFILANVFEQLVLLDDFDEQMLICAGALVDGRPVGALIAQMLEDNEIFIHSIVVNTPYQRCGIGTDMIKGVLSDSLDILTGENSIEAFPTRVFLHIDYALKAQDIGEFEAFLKNFGFKDYYEMDNCFYIESSRLELRGSEGTAGSEASAGNEAAPSVKVFSFTEADETYADDVSQFLYSRGLNINTDNAFFIAEGDDVKAVISAEYGMDDEYYVRSFSKDSADVSKAEFSALFAALCVALKKENDSFVIVADGYENINKDQLKKLAEECGEVYIHREAGYYADFSPIKA